MLLLDYGAIADLRKKMQGGSAPPPEIQPMGQVPITAPTPQAAPPPPQMLPVAEPPPIVSAPPKPSIWSKINDLGKPTLDEGTRALLTPSQIKKAESGGGLLGRIATQALGLGIFTPEIQARGRAAMMSGANAAALKMQDEQTTREQSAAERGAVEAVRSEMPAYPDANDYAATLSWNRAFIGKLMSRGLIKQASQMAQYLDTTPPKELGQQALQREDNVLGADGKPYIVWTDAYGKEVKRERQYVAPKGEMTEYQRLSLALRSRELGARVKDETGVQLSGPAIEKLIALDDAIAATADATMAMGAAKAEKANVSGRVGGVIPVPGWVRNQVGQGGETGRSARSKIGNLTSMIGNLRSGGAITPQEFDRLETFLPTPNDDEAVIDGKLKDFSAFLQQMRKTRLEAYQKYGKGGSGAGQSKPATQDQKDWDEAVALHGKEKVLKEFGPRPEGE